MSLFVKGMSDASLSEQWSEEEEQDDWCTVWVDYRGRNILETNNLCLHDTIGSLRDMVERVLGHGHFYLVHEDDVSLHCGNQLSDFSSTVFGIKLMNVQLEQMVDQFLLGVARMK